ncbi:MAG: CoA-binding protein [Candidatus Methanofastidiosa archaeon]|nr:CoA-binding protein [Candidatus Methanofastidiosa archaeon]
MSDPSALQALFYPRSVAVVGASKKRTKIGYEITKNLRRFSGTVYAVTTSKGQVDGLPTYPSVADIPGDVDLAVLAIPAPQVAGVLEECGKKGVRAAVIISAGFSEAGNAEGERQLTALAARYDMALVGPNTVGIANTDVDLNATFLVQPTKGGIAFLTQSGALGAAVMYKTVYEDIGFSKFASLGNMAGATFGDLLDYLAEDEQTTSIALYIEGVQDGRAFLKAARACSKRKPVIALKSGSSQAGKRAATSHTGSLAGDDAIYDAAFRQAGIIRARTIDDMLDMAKAFSQPRPGGGSVAILTNAGGPGILAADACEHEGLTVAPLAEETKEALRGVLPPFASVTNPIDTIAQAGYEEYAACMRILQKDPHIDAILAVIVVPTFTRIGYSTHAQALLDSWKRKKTLVTCFMSGEVTNTSVELMKLNGIPAYPSPERAARALGALHTYERWYHEHHDSNTD